ncbi:hypothetical protein OH76DRAFT_1556930 [Lentinus brumalis]|uniref:DUF6533 domain-containing protein n=1 Tax=Lentinus brumalis TaxID=2498619 RepID=A0A371D7W8_9APHY|nr:hypothetical protein OH76DRAFT_1556930 [Polyporus brumalis]
MSEISGLTLLSAENYCIVASTALLWFDFALTFTTEVRRIWRRRFTGATVVYLFTRYTALVQRIFFVLEVFLWNSTNEMCGRIGRVDDILTITNYLAVAFTTIAKAADVAADAIVITLIWVKTFGIVKVSSRLGVRTPLATLLLRDGTAYFLILLVPKILTIIGYQIESPLILWLLWPYFDQVFTVIFLSRFMLDLRGIYFAEHITDDGNATGTATRSVRMPSGSDIRFTTSNIVGNLGATLSTTLTHSDFPTTYPASSHPEGDTRASEEAGLGLPEWYMDEVPRYTSHPFEEGMMLPIWVDDPRVTDVVLEEVQSPLSLDPSA